MILRRPWAPSPAPRRRWRTALPLLLLPFALAAATPAQTPPDTLPVVPVRCEKVSGYARLSFLWTDMVDYQVNREGPDVVVAFRRPARIDADTLAHERSACARWVGWRPVDGGVIVTLRLPDGNEARDARLGNRVVIDVFPTPSAPRAPAVPPSAPPTATTPAQDITPTPSPSPAATAAVAGGAVAEGTTMLRFSWPQPVAAAVAVRDRTMWLVFDQPSQQDAQLIRRIAGERWVAAVQQRAHPRATILELTTTEPLFPRLEKDGLAWVVHLASTRPPAAAEGIVPLPVTGDSHGSRLRLPVAEPGEPIAVSDPVAGSLIFVPLREVGRGLAHGYAYGEARLLASLQGVAIAPLADDLTVQSLTDAIELSRPHGFAVSPARDAQRVLARLQAVDHVDCIVPAQDWPDGSLAAVRDRQQATHGADSAAGASDQDLALLARTYVAAGLAAEALGATEMRLARRPELSEDRETRLLAGIARYGLGRVSEAAADFAVAGVAATDEGRMWAMLARHAAGDGGAIDPPSLPVWTTLIATYPQPLARTAGVALLAAAVDGGEPATAWTLLAALRTLSPTPVEMAALDYQEGRLHAAAGETDAALAAWDRLSTGRASRPAAEAVLARTALLRQSGGMTPEAAVDALAALQVRWRGDKVEFATLRDLGQARADAGDELAALQVWRDAVSLYDREPESRELGRKMATFFRDTFMGESVDRLPPWKAVLLFDQFKELVPAETGGLALLGRYADRLVAADLLPQATEVFERLLKSPLNPQQRGQVGLRLAEARLADGAAADALDALKRTDHAELAADVLVARRRLAARAQLALGHPAEAIALIDRDNGEAADAIRLAAQRSGGDWSGAAATLQRQRPHSLDLAAALTLAKDGEGLARLQAEPAAADEQADAVRLMAAPATAVLPRPAAVAAAVAEAERLAKLTRQALTTPPASTSAQ
ncbi:MAG: hypothetical protein U1E42_09335 [Rhodospirillales bacterium]